nr:hypothetical protein [Francisella tularensis]
MVFASSYIRRKVTAHNQRKLILNGYYFVIIITIINILSSYIFDNIYIFIFLNALLTIGLAFVNITTTSKVIDLLKEGFAAGNAVIGLVKFTVAGTADFFLSFLSISKLMIGIPAQQLGFIVASVYFY